MGFEKLGFDFFASLFVFLRRCVYLVITPYKTMRRITLNGDYYQVALIFLIALLYFLFSRSVRGGAFWGVLSFVCFLILFFATVAFFYLFAKPFQKGITVDGFIYAFAYTLIPTLLWFWSNFALYIILPPPRTMSILGRGFSVLFIAYSISLLVWKFILVYFAIRFSSRLGLYRIIYMLIIYAAAFFPVSVMLYYFRIFRVPFI